jgi:glycosyltransferase involved in cell wall biosynthesis
MRICIVYDCLFPYTIGGAERWYRNLAERLSADGHTVTYLTLRQWEGELDDLAGVDVRVVGPRLPLYTTDGRRRVVPPLVFGAGVLFHLVRHGRDYDAVHTCAFPYFSVLAAAAVRPLRRYAVVVDWFEVWSRSYWRDYLGRVGGAIGAWVQRRCTRVRQRAFCFSRLHAERLRTEGLRGEVQMLTGIYDGSLTSPEPTSPEPLVVFAGRHIPEKRAPVVPAAVALAAQRVPGLRGLVFGDGPDRTAVLAAIERDAPGLVDAPGRVASDQVDDALRRALCMLLPSSREGYGLVVIEAAARGCPSIVVRGEDNAAVELVDDGVNGVVAASAEPMELQDAIVRVWEAGDDLRRSTREWFTLNAQRVSLEASLDAVVASYGSDSAQPS